MTPTHQPTPTQEQPKESVRGCGRGWLCTDCEQLCTQDVYGIMGLSTQFYNHGSACRQTSYQVKLSSTASRADSGELRRQQLAGFRGAVGI